MHTYREAVEPKGDICESLLIVERLKCCKVGMLVCY